MNEDEQLRRCRTFLPSSSQGQRRRRWEPLDGAIRSTDSLEEGGNHSSGTASSDEDDSSLSQRGLLTNDRRRTATTTPTPTSTTTVTSRTKTTSARRSSSSRGPIRQTWRRRSTSGFVDGQLEALQGGLGALEDIWRWESSTRDNV